MEYETEYSTKRSDEQQFAGLNAEDIDVLDRLERLIAENRKTELTVTGIDPYDGFEAAAMNRPIDPVKALSYFGAAIGTIIPGTIMLLLAINANEKPLLATLGTLAVAGTAVAGYFSGKYVGNLVRRIETMNVFAMVGLALLIGLAWGIVSGGFGGLFFFGIGSIPGAILGGIVGASVLPVFTLFHRGLKRGDVIELSHLLPIIFGITLTVAAAFIGTAV